MCLAALAHQAHPRWRLVIAANRDEFHARPAAPLARWTDGSGIIGGRDLSAGGTWLGLTEAGRLALVTNYRVPGFPRPERPSRGGLVTAVLGGADPAAAGLAAMNPCTLLTVDPAGACIHGNHPQPQANPLTPGVHGLSNGPISPPWAKTRRVMDALERWLGQAATGDPAPLFAALADRTPTAATWDEGGPEPRLSSVFIADPDYGTRCSTVVLVDRDGQGTICERRFEADGRPAGTETIAFRW